MGDQKGKGQFEGHPKTRESAREEGRLWGTVVGARPVTGPFPTACPPESSRLSLFTKTGHSSTRRPGQSRIVLSVSYKTCVV